MKPKGIVKIYEKDEEGNFTKLVKTSPNLFVDDGKELMLDYLLGIKSWWNPLEQTEYGSGNVGWNTTRYIGLGTMMFNNSSFERASGIEGIPTGEEYSYPVDSTFLVSPEDSFLSKEVGNRVAVSCTRRDQTVEITALVQVPSDIPYGTKIREFGLFLKSTGPNHDPSQHEASKPYAMICRSALYDTGWYNESGPCNKDDSGAKVCYSDDYYEVIDDIHLEWEFGEI